MPPPRTFPKLKERQEYIQESNNGLSWYLTFEEPKKKCLEQIEKTENKEIAKK